MTMQRTLFRPNYYEDTNIPTGSERVLLYEELPSRTQIAGIRYRVGITSNSDVNLTEYSTCELSCYYLPVSGTDEAAVIGTNAAMLDYLRKFVPGHESTIFNPTTAGAAGPSWTPSSAEQNLADTGSTQDSLTYEIYELPIEFLSDVNTWAPLLRRRIHLGWQWGNSYRPGTKDKARHLFVEQGIIRRGINMGQHPGYLVWLFANPNDFSASEFDDEDTRHARGKEFENLRFLAPNSDRISGVTKIAPSTESDALAWVQGVYYSNGTRQWAQKALDINLEAITYVSRAPRDMVVATDNTA